MPLFKALRAAMRDQRKALADLLLAALVNLRHRLDSDLIT